MGFNCGIIGLPNVGKSTIFNALASAGAPMSSYAFCTIEPNRGVVPVPDERLTRLGEILAKPHPIPTKIEFTDVAGLVEGASKGEGLGNKFLGHIRGVDSLVHVVRCFHSEDVVHVMGGVDPLRDVAVINTELALADLDVVSRAREKIIKKAQSGDKESQARCAVMDRLLKILDEGRMLRQETLAEEEALMARELGLITVKPTLYLANLDEQDQDSQEAAQLAGHAEDEGAAYLPIVGSIEEEISELPQEEKLEYLEAMGLAQSGLDRVIATSYKQLDLVTFYTITTDLQAWTIPTGTLAPKAAGKIHTDFEHGFIRAEVFHYDDLLEAGTEHALRQKGMIRSEGKAYTIEDGDVVHFLFNV